MKKIYHRNIIPESNDFENMVHLQTDFYGKGNHDWTVGRLYAWRYGLWTPESRNPDVFSKSAELFFDQGGELQGFLVLEECGGNVATLFAPNDEEILGKMVDFLARGGNFGQTCSIYCSKSRLEETKVFQRYGYCDVSYEDVTFEYDAKDIVLPVVEIPEGYTLTDQNIYADIEKMERFRFDAFNPDAEFSEEIAWAYRYARENPFVKKELCIVLLDEKKNPVSSCVGQLDRANLDLEVEVVCTRKDAEGKGFAKTVIAECIRRGLEMGVEKVNISGWNSVTKHLYSSFGKSTVNQKICVKNQMSGGYL